MSAEERAEYLSRPADWRRRYAHALADNVADALAPDTRTREELLAENADLKRRNDALWRTIDHKNATIAAYKLQMQQQRTYARVAEVYENITHNLAASSASMAEASRPAPKPQPITQPTAWQRFKDAMFG